MKSIPVFMYHHVNWHQGDLVTLTPEDFESHLRVLSKEKIQTLFFDELVGIVRGEKKISGPAVALTFDDGYLDNWIYAFPLLRKYQMKATIFVITSWMQEGEKRTFAEEGRKYPRLLPIIPRHREAKARASSADPEVSLRWEEARAMEFTGWVDIQSHTHFHRDYFLPAGKGIRLDPEKKSLFLEDLVRSKKMIEDRLEKKCRFLSWPWGRYDTQTIDLAKSLDFEGLGTTEKGVNYRGSSEWKIKRIGAKWGDPKWFSRRIKIYSHRRIGEIYSQIAGKI